MSREEAVDGEVDDTDAHAVHLIRNGSTASLAARAQMQEEGQMHKFGQAVRRGILANSSEDSEDPIPAHVAQLRAKLEQFSGEGLRQEVEKHGLDNIMSELGVSVQELNMLERQDPESYEKFKQAQMAAEHNMRHAEGSAHVEQPSIYAVT